MNGDHVVLNARTVRDGEILVELLGADKKPIPGFSKDDCASWQGDEKFGAVTWKGGNIPPQDKVRVKFYISSAMLYGWAWE